MHDFQEFEDDVNGFANYYGGQNHKKWAHYIEFEEREFGEKKHLKLFRLFPVRWAASHLLSLQVNAFVIHH